MLQLLTLAADHCHFSSTRHPVLHLFNAGLPWMSTAHALARTQPVASDSGWLPLQAVYSALYLPRRSHLLVRILKLKGFHGVDCVPA